MSTIHNEDIFLKRQRLEKVKAQEMLELQQEEEYLRHIRREKEQVERIAEEFQGNYDLIEDLKIQVEQGKKYKLYYEKYGTIKDLLEATISKLEAKEAENDQLKQENIRWQRRVEESERRQNETKVLESEVKALKQELTEADRQIQSKESLERTLRMELKKAEEVGEQLEMKLNKDQEIRLRLEKDLYGAEEKFFHLQTRKELINISMSVDEEQFDQLLETLKELEKEKDMSVRLNLDNQQIKMEAEDCLDIRRQLAAQAQVLKKQELLFEELRTSKLEDERRICSLQDEIAIRDKELSRGKQINSKLSKEYDQGQIYIVELEERVAELQKECQTLRDNGNELLEKQNQENIYRQELSRTKSELQDIRNSEIHKINSLFDKIMNQTKQQF